MRGRSSRRLAVGWLACTLAALTATGCGSSSSEPDGGKAPAHVHAEEDLVTVELTPEAERRLALATAPVVLDRIRRRRTVAGELLLPLAQPDARGSRSVFSLLPSMTPTDLIRVAEMQVDADGQVAAAQVQLDAAKVALTRADQLIESKAGTKRGADEARTQVQLAEAALRTTREKRALLGTAVFDAVRSGALWVRVSLYAGDLDAIDGKAEAIVQTLRAAPDAPGVRARRVPVPMSAATAPATVDLFYELDGAGTTLRPGQRVSVDLPLQDEGDSLLVPSAAVLYDVHGGAWVYVQTAPHAFTRQRVELRRTDDRRAVLARGPAPGAVVVTDGATELFGTEFGSGK